MLVIKIYEYEKSVVGDWDLNQFDINNMHIPSERVKDLITSTNSSQGILKKFNIVSKGTTYYIKSGSGKLYRVKEPIIESIVSKVGALLGFNVVKYKLWTIDRNLFSNIELSEQTDLTNYESERIISTPKTASFERCLTDNNKVLVCVSQSFMPSDKYTFVSCDQLTKGIQQQQLYETLCCLGEGIKEQLDQMILFDYIVNNTDRHRKNFGFLKSESNEIRMAALFDHGLSLFSDFNENEIVEHGMELLNYSDDGKPFGELGASLRKYVSRESLQNIRFEIQTEELLGIIDFYAPIIGTVRAEIMKSIVKLRWEYARKLLFEVQR